MNQHRQEQTDGATSAEPKAQWARPELVRLDAAVAEAADINSTDGSFTS